jgi:two-component system sensor histidine kinase UhpB
LRGTPTPSVVVALTRGPGNVVLTITDNGQGLTGAPEGAGIRGMRERAILIGADLTLDPVPRGGTVLRLIVPLPDKGTTS